MSMLSTTKSRNSCLILAIFFALLLQGATFAQTILRVDGDDGLAGGDGTSWPTAYKYLQDAITFARANPAIYDLWVASTIPSNPYRPDRDAANEGGTGLRESTFLLNFNNVQLLGGFPPGGGDLAERDPALYETVLSGDITNSYEGVCGPGNGDCYQNNGTPGCEDAACCELVCLVDPYCCEVAWDDDCAIFANLVCGTCGEPGAGSCFEPNDTPGCDDAECCAVVCGEDPICCFDPWEQACADLAVANCPMIGNNAYHVVTVDGVDDSVRIDGVSVIGGFANGILGNDGVGAGMLIVDASPAVVRVTFTANSAPVHGGGAMHIEGTAHPLLVNCSMTANDGTFGGAMHIDPAPASATLVNCLISGNTATSGGAIDARSDFPATLDLINCTVTDNTAQNSGGGIWVFGTMEVTVTNSILWGNVPDQIDGAATVTYSDVQGGWGVPMDMNIDEDPLFVAAGINYRLDYGSPCIDAADNDVVPCDQFDIDQNGEGCAPAPLQDTPDLDLTQRRIDDPDTDDTGFGDPPIVDMGAYEFEPCPWDLDEGCFVGVGDLLIMLANWNNPYGIGDLLALLAAWGPCQCDPDADPLTLQEELADACLTQDHWDDFVDVMTDEESSQAKKDRYKCWMVHYLDHCDRCTCQHLPECPSPDPYT